MILTTEYLQETGLKLSVDDSVANKAIEDAELFYVKSVIGDDNYIRLLNEPVPESIDYAILNGGVYEGKYYAGLKRAIAHIAYAFLLRMNVNAVRFGTVRKYDENSSNVDERLLYSTSKHHFTIGKAYLKEVTSIMVGCDWKNANGCQFDEYNNLI